MVGTAVFVLQTSTTPGTGPLDLDAASDPFRGFVAAGLEGADIPYVIQLGTGVEFGKCVITDASPDTITRTDADVRYSTNGNNRVDWGAGSKNIWCPQTLPISLGASRPADAGNGTFWVDSTNTPYVLNFYDGAVDIPLMEIDATDNNAVPSPAGQRLQGFVFRLRNDGGTIKHQFGGPGAGAPGTFFGKINGAITSETTTPTATDSSTAFAAGAKISSASPSAIIFDTAAQIAADSLPSCSITFNDTGTALTVDPQVISRDVDGVTWFRAEYRVKNASSGADFDLTAIASGKIIDFQFRGNIK